MSVTVNTSFTFPEVRRVTLGLFTDSVGADATLLIVPVPCAVEIVEFVGLDRLTLYVRLVLKALLPMTGTVMFSVVVPAAKVSVPLVIV